MLNPFRRIPFIRAVVIANVVVYVGLWLVGSRDPWVVSLAVAWFGLWLDPHLLPWQPVTYAFIHANLAHLGLNMLGLWMFGSEMERAWGSRRIAVYYLACVLGAAAAQLAVAALRDTHAPTIGASGGVFGILLAFAMVYPNRIILLLIPPVPMKAKWVVLGYGALELWLGVTGTMAGVAHFAHLGGMVFGWFLIQYWRFTGRRRPLRA